MLDRQEWLERRAKGMGGSDAPIALGLSPWRSPHELWEEKMAAMRGEPPTDEPPSMAMRIGSALEDFNRELGSEVLGRPVRRVLRLVTHKTLPWMIGNLDGEAGDTVYEAKATAFPGQRWGAEDDPAGVPADVRIQALHYLAVTGKAACHIGVVFTGSKEFRLYTLERDAAEVQDLEEAEYDLLWRHVEAGTPPDWDGSEAAAEFVRRRYPNGDPEAPPMMATPDMEMLARNLRAATITRKEAVKAEEAIKAKVADTMGTHTVLSGRGFTITYRNNKPSTVIGWDNIAAAYRRLLEAQRSALDPSRVLEDLKVTEDGDPLDTIESLHTGTKPGARVLRPVFEDEE